MLIIEFKMIGDFTSIFELAAGLNAAFVVVEYSRSFSKQLYENAFKFDSHIDNEISASQDLIDEETLRGLESVKCGDGDTGQLIEQIRRDKEILERFIEKKRDALKAKAKNTCELRSHSGLSLLNFLFCLFVLFLTPFETVHPTMTQYLLLSVSFLIIIAQIICWIGDACANQKQIFFYSLTSSIKHSIWLFMISACISLIAYFVLNWQSISWKLNDQWFLTALYVAAFVPFLNFVVFTAIFKKRLNGVQDDIKRGKTEVIDKCKVINELASKVNTVSEVSHMLQVTNE